MSRPVLVALGIIEAGLVCGLLVGAYHAFTDPSGGIAQGLIVLGLTAAVASVIWLVLAEAWRS